MPPAPPTLTEDAERELLHALFTTTAPLPDLARAFNLDLIELLDLIASPHFQSRLIALEQAAAHATRISASRHLHAVINTISESLHAHLHNLTLLQSRTDEPALEQRHQERAQARRQAATVLRLTRFSPLAPDTILKQTPIARTPSVSERATVAFALPQPRNPSPPSKLPPPMPPAPAPFELTPAPCPMTTLSPQPEPPTVPSRRQSPSANTARGGVAPTPRHRERALEPTAAIHAYDDTNAPISFILCRAGTPLPRAP